MSLFSLETAMLKASSLPMWRRGLLNFWSDVATVLQILEAASSDRI